MSPKDEFFVEDGHISQGAFKRSKMQVGKKYATTLTGFIAGIIVGLLSMYIILTLFV